MSLRLALARVGRRSRLAAAAACLLLAAVTALEDAGSGRAAPAVSATRAVAVAARQLPAGRVLTPRDIATVRWPAALAPPGSGALAGPLAGRTLAGPLARGEPITPRRLLDPGLTAGLGPATVAITVDTDVDTRGLVAAGARVDLLAVRRPETLGEGPERPAERVAAAVLVLAALPAPGTSDGGTAGGRLVLAVARAQATRIAGLRPTRVYTVVVAAP